MTIGVLGLGAVGGSIALAAEAQGESVVAWDPDVAARNAAEASGLSISADLSAASIVVLAAPMVTLADDLAAMLSSVTVNDNATLTDVGSLKVPVARSMSELGWAGRYVGGHPMAGTEHSGFPAARADLFAGAAWVLCLEDETDLGRWVKVAELATRLGAEVVPLAAQDHDRAMGLISGLPHLLALGLSRRLAGSEPYAHGLIAGSFRDATRVAASSPDLLRAVTVQNEEHVRAALAGLIAEIDGPWHQLVPVAGHQPPVVRSNRSIPAIDRNRLRDLGRRGGRVLGVAEDLSNLMIADPERSPTHDSIA